MKESMKRSLRTNRGFSVVLFGVVVLALGLLGADSARAAFDANDNGNRAEIIGPIISLPTTADLTGEWTVGRTKVSVTKDTKIDQERGKPVVGAVVEVNGARALNGVITATEIEVRLSPAGGLPIKFSGKIEELPSTAGRVGDWKVSGKVIHVTASTEIEQDRGQVAVGALVEIEGLAQTDGSINALEIEVKPDFGGGLPVKFLGKVEKIPSTTGRIGDWVISGRTVRVTANTLLKTERGDFMAGSLVDVEGLAQNDGSINATKIENRGNIENPQITVYFRGTIETLPDAANFIGDWKVSGRTVRVNDKTVLNQEKGKIAVGAFIEIVGVLQNDGSVAAQKVAVRETPNPPGYVKFVGKITQLPNATGFIGDWKVGERTVHVTAATKIDATRGQVAVGALVEVEGTLRGDRSVDAGEIEVKHNNNDTANYIRLYGKIDALPGATNLTGAWTVGGRTVYVTERTRIRREHGAPVVGAFVEVEGNQRADNSIDAYNIEVERDADAPAGTVGFINFYGQIKGLPTAANFVGDWTVGAKKVTVSETTRIDTRRGAVTVMAFAEVYGYLIGDGSVRALKIEIRPVPSTSSNAAINRSYVEVIGKIDKLPEDKNYIGVWTVDGRPVNVRERTVIRRERAVVAVGATVEIYGAELANGDVDAKFIEVEHGPAGASFQSYAPLASVSAGSYQESNAASAIIASFGANLATSAASATKLPLPTTLGGVSVLVDGRPAGLFFVSPNQVNYQVPDGMLPGAAQVTVTRNGVPVAQGTLSLDDVAPNLFTANASGQGVPAGTLLRVKANGQQVYEPLARLEAGKFVPVTIRRQAGERLFLVLYGSGLRGAGDADGNASNGVAENVQVTIGGLNAPVIFAGAAPGFAGLDQFNVEIPANASGANLTVMVKVSNGEGKVMPANAVSISIQ